MGLGVSQFGLNLSGYVFSLQNGLTEITPGVGELGGSLIKETIIDGGGLYHFKVNNSGLSTLFVRSTGHVGVNLAFPPAISFAIGDNDTGFDWISDGILSSKSQNQEIFRFRWINDPMELFSIGTTTLDSVLHLRASTANYSSLKIDSGTLLSSPQDGVIEYDGSLWYATIGATRNTFSFINVSETFSGQKTFSLDIVMAADKGITWGSGNSIVETSTNLVLTSVSNIDLVATGDLNFNSVNLSFFGATPSPQGAAISDAAGGATVDAEARTAINSLLQVVRDFGLIAP